MLQQAIQGFLLQLMQQRQLPLHSWAVATLPIHTEVLLIQYKNPGIILYAPIFRQSYIKYRESQQLQITFKNTTQSLNIYTTPTVLSISTNLPWFKQAITILSRIFQPQQPQQPFTDGFSLDAYLQANPIILPLYKLHHHFHR
jgi:hypothetical protein